MKELLIIMVRVYQKVISPHLKSRCRFMPSCSDYFLEALERKGATQGTLLGIKRILKCHPFGDHGWDPVP